MQSKLKGIDETKTEIEYHFFPIEPRPNKIRYYYLTPMSINGNFWSSKREVFYYHYINNQGFLIHGTFLPNPLSLSHKLDLYVDEK